ncbi:potassium voltage-gated channel subfamily G member 3-like [Engraulis encrasicolus]|uniref:potassium voltage-gated channel subfamily G member 3-like n=1 Tax=Engraulis encrasicolus TaxID=184585 RepID=UPI002FD56878
MKFGKNICILNVGGTKYAFSREIIKNFPLRRVSRLHNCSSEKEVLEVCDDYDRERNEFFFDRHAEAFVFIMLYVRSGRLRFAPQMCELSFYNEMIYWGLESSHLEFCCQRRLDDRMSDTFTYFCEEDVKPEEECREERTNTPVPSKWNITWVENLRRIFEEPASSVVAQIFAALSVIFVIISMVILCASTLPDWETAKHRKMEEHRVIEAVCISWFTAECVMRFLLSRDKCQFVRQPLNVIDMLAISPYYVLLVATALVGESLELQRAGILLCMLRMTRVFWLVKLARHFDGLQTLGRTLRHCRRELVMLLVFMCVAMAIFSALAQLLEHGLDLQHREVSASSNSQDYNSIPAASWWVIISMTTVGYGDMYPITVPGRVLGGVCVVSGIVLLSLPISFIYHSFLQCYHQQRFRQSTTSSRQSQSLSTVQ